MFDFKFDFLVPLHLHELLTFSPLCDLDLTLADDVERVPTRALSDDVAALVERVLEQIRWNVEPSSLSNKLFPNLPLRMRWTVAIADRRPSCRARERSSGT